MPWKNGGGDTIEIAVDPPDADLDHIAWRVSLATMTADGPFSVFPELDRTVTVVGGTGLELRIGHRDPVRRDADSDPLRFPADLPCAARLLAGPVMNLNVMSRRSRVDHAVSRIAVRGPLALNAGAATLLMCCAGSLAVDDRVLDLYDTLVPSEPVALQLVPLSRQTSALLIILRPV